MLRKVKGTKSSKIKAYKKEIDGLIFVQERQIPVQTAEELTNCQRPLRAQTAQGERNSLASSEEIAAGAMLRIFYSGDGGRIGAGGEGVAELREAAGAWTMEKQRQGQIPL